MSEHLEPHAKDCIAACNECAANCLHCFTHMAGKASNNECPRCCIECAAVCRLTADAVARHSPFAKQIAALCAEVCDWCVKECGAHDHGHCKDCAESSKRCAAVCRKMAA